MLHVIMKIIKASFAEQVNNHKCNGWFNLDVGKLTVIQMYAQKLDKGRYNNLPVHM